MFKLLKNFKWQDYCFLLVVIGLVVLQVWLDLRMPEYLGSIIGELQKSQFGLEVDINTILINGGYMLACAVGSLVSMIINGFLISNISSRFAFNIRQKVYDKVQGFSLAEISKFSTASLITRTTNDITQVQMVIVMGMQALFKAPILAVWSILKILNISTAWSAAVGVAVLTLIVMIAIIVILAMPMFKKIQTLTDDINRVTREHLTGIRVIRASNAEEYQEEKFAKYNNNLTKAYLFTGRVMSVLGPGMTIIMSGLSLAIYWIGAYIVKTPTDFANMMTFTTYAMNVLMAFMLLIMIFILMPRAIVSAKRINEVLDTQNMIVSGQYVDENLNSTASVVFKNVSFKYPDAEEYVLENISFEAHDGETVAFIGSTGSGKSTLINLIPRLYDCTEGEILIDGVNVKDYDLENLNKKIGYVPQRGVLFSGTVKSNIDFGDNNADDETIKKAISVAQATNFVSRMSDGIDSKISQGGTNVSGGQKQRLSIARAIARKPEIFIFDDSFSALDYKTDRKLRTALTKHTNKATKFIVAQRIGTIKDADKIIVLDNGKVVGIGKHDELLKKCSVYKEIALSQLSKEEL